MSTFEMAALRKMARNVHGGLPLRLDPAAHDLRALMGFSTREDYVAWVRDWKASMAEVTAACREAKRVRRSTPAETAEHGQAQARREYLRVDAANLLLLRKAARTEGGAQRAARLSQEVAA